MEQESGFDAEILTGNVVFFHEGAFMYCDSAYLYQKTNTFEAFSNVRMEQVTPSSFTATTSTMTEIPSGQAADNIRMEDRTATLFTDSLDYDRVANLGYYFEGGMLVDEEKN